jgi:hypothetical protein
MKAATPPPITCSPFTASFSDVEATGEKFDGLIITGAPIEHLPFEEVTYWDELTRVFRLDAKPCAFDLWRLLGRHGHGLAFPRAGKAHAGPQGLRLFPPSQPGARQPLSARLFG